MVSKAYSYLRFSTPEQAAGDSFRRQSEMAAAYAAKNGLELDTELTFRDLGVSAFRGKNAETGALGVFLDAVEQGVVEPGSTLLVEALDRISRGVARKAVRILEEIVEGGVDVVTLKDGKRYTKESLDGFDFLMAILLLIRGHEESDSKSKRLKAAWQNKRARLPNGNGFSAVAPGWIAAAKDEKPKLIEKRAQIVRRVFDMFLAGSGKEAIAKTFNAEHVPTFGRAKFWQRSYIQKILCNPAVVGVFIPHTLEDGKERKPLDPIEAYYPAAIPLEVWKRAQALLKTSGKTKTRPGSVVNMLAGLARCPGCGATMTRVVKGERSKPRLICVRAKAGARDLDGSDFCTYRSVPLDLVEWALVTNAEMFARAVPARDANLQQQIDDLDRAWTEASQDLSNLVNVLARQPSTAIERKVRELETECERMRTDLEGLKARAAQSESKLVARRAERLTAALQRSPLDKAACNAALRECFASATVDYNAGELRLRWRHSERDATVIYDAGFEALAQ
jgi:DNA invertase Pin-like site-specific DNA recombinase